MNATTHEMNPVKLPLRIVRIAELTKMVGLSRSSIYEKLNPRSRYYDENFPKPVKLGAASVGWLSTAIETWISSKVKGV